MLVNYDHEHVTKPKRIVIDPLNQKRNEYYKDSEYVTGPAKMDQVGTQILTTFFTFVAS